LVNVSSEISEWKGIKLDLAKDILKNRFIIQMQSWINCIQTARRYGELMPESYYEVKYENLCTNPVKEFEKICRFLNVDFRPEAQDFIIRHAHKKAIGKWKHLNLTDSEWDDYKNAINLGRDLLEKLGYNNILNERP